MAITKTDVVVVGAGMSGLVAVKSCLEENLSVICYEKTDSIGGNWKFREDGLSCMKSTTLNVSKEIMAFSDFPFPAEAPNFQVCHEYVEYLESYATHFNLTPHIQLQHDVICIEPGPQFKSVGDWKVTAKNQRTETYEEIIASNIILCAGHYRKPHFAPFPGLDTFTGLVLHSSQYKQPQGFENKNILVVGQGNFACDIAVELGNVAKKVYCITKPGVLVFSRLGKDGYPYDITTFTRFNLLKWIHWSGFDGMTKDFLKTCRVQIDGNLYGLPLNNFRPDAHVPTINDLLPYSILTGRIRMKNPVERFTSNAVVFQGSPTEHPIDVVIMATGFDIPEFSFFHNQELTAQDLRYGLYKRVFPIKFEHQTVASILSLRFIGSASCLAELQSRWAAAVFSRRVSLPPRDVMKHEVETGFGSPTCSPFASDAKLPVLMPIPYCDDVALFIGCRPNYLQMFFTDFRLFKALMFGPCVSYKYRLTGPHSWSKARETILTIPQRVKAGFGNRFQDKTDGKHSLKYSILIGLCAGTVIYYFSDQLAIFIQQWKNEWF